MQPCIFYATYKPNPKPTAQTIQKFGASTLDAKGSTPLEQMSDFCFRYFQPNC